MSANYLDRHELLKEAREAHDKFKQWRIDNNIEPGAQYVKRIMRGAIPPPPPISDAFYIMLWRMGKGLMSGPSFNGYSDDWKDEMLMLLAESLIHFHGKFDYTNDKYQKLSEDEMARGCFAFFTKCIKRTFYAALLKLNAKLEAEKEMLVKADYDYYHTYTFEDVEDTIIRKEFMKEWGLDEDGNELEYDKPQRKAKVETKRIRKHRVRLDKIRIPKIKKCEWCGKNDVIALANRKYCDDCRDVKVLMTIAKTRLKARKHKKLENNL